MIEIKCYNLYGNNEVVVEKANGEKLMKPSTTAKILIKIHGKIKSELWSLHFFAFNVQPDS